MTFTSPSQRADAIEAEFSEAFELRCGHDLVTCLRSERHGLVCSECSAPVVRKIAEACGVTHQLVATVRRSSLGESPSERTYTTKHGTEASS